MLIQYFILDKKKIKYDINIRKHTQNQDQNKNNLKKENFMDDLI